MPCKSAFVFSIPSANPLASRRASCTAGEACCGSVFVPVSDLFGGGSVFVNVDLLGGGLGGSAGSIEGCLDTGGVGSKSENCLVKGVVGIEDKRASTKGFETCGDSKGSSGGGPG